MPPRKSPSPVRKSPKRSPVRRSPVKEAAYILDEVDVAPSREIFTVMNYIAYLFVLTALAAGIAWVVYVAKANEEDPSLLGDDHLVNTATVCFQAAVVSALLYFVARHHFHQHH